MPASERVDDSTVADDEVLWRRIHPTWIVLKEGKETLSSAAFKDEELSVHIASLTTRDAVLARYPRHRLSAFTAGQARREGFIVLRDPIPEDVSHALVLPREKPTRGDLARQARKLRDLARLT
jgi:hypothetical protein